MAELPLKKLRNFGGKLGAELAELGCSTAGQARWRISSGVVIQGVHAGKLAAPSLAGCACAPVQGLGVGELAQLGCSTATQCGTFTCLPLASEPGACRQCSAYRYAASMMRSWRCP